MKTKEILEKKFRFKTVYWFLILLSTLVAAESFVYQQLPSVLYFVAMWVSLPLQFLFLYSEFVGRKKPIDNSEALTVYVVIFVMVNLFSNPYSPIAWFWYLFIFIDAVFAPIILIWSGIKLFNPNISEA